MKTVKPQKLGVLCRTFVHDDRVYLTVSVLLCSPFDAPRALMTEAELWKLVEEELVAEKGLLDEGQSKQQGEVLVTGKCWVPGGAAQPVSFVRAQIGSVDKRLAVLGERQWRHGVPTAPEPFLEMPIDWAHAFGGEGFAQNPLGKGHGGKAQLPNVEDPKHLVVSPGDKPAPAGFGAWDFTWPQRFSLVGTYDEKWLRTRFPGYAGDLDPSIFNVAPKDQRIVGYFKGNEAFVVENMHPTKPRLTGSLPGAVVRVFIQQRGEASHDGAASGPKPRAPTEPSAELGPLREVVTRVDTVRLIPHRERAVIIYRGVIAIREDDAFDVAHLLLGCEDPSEPKPISHYEAVLAARLDRERGALLALKDDDLMPPAALGWVPRAGTSDVARMVQKEDLLAKNLRRKQEGEIAKGREKILAMGLDPAAFNLANAPPEPPAVDADDIDATILRMEQDERDAAKQAEEFEIKKTEMVAEARAAFAAQNQDYDAAVEKARRDIAGPPKFRAREQLDWLKGNLKIAREGNAPLLDLEAKAEDPAFFAQLQAQERQLFELYRKGAHFQPPVEPRGAEGSEPIRVELEAAHHNEIGMPDRDFTGADLSWLLLAGMDLSGAFLESADLTGTDLRGANLTGAVLAHATLAGTILVGAKLDGANLGGATLDGADLSNATLEGAILARATIKDTSFQRAKLGGVNFLETKFAAGADFGGVAAVQAVFHGVDMRGARFVGADLTKCVFAECKLGGADFTSANLTRGSFVTTNADGALFLEATLDGCRFVADSSLVDADLTGASAQRGLFRGVPMTRAKLPGLRADTADFSECDLADADLHQIVARGALFMRTDLSRARMAGADLLGAILQKATLHGTDLRGANLFRADLVRVRVDGATRIDEANMTQARVYPRANDGPH